MKLANTNIKKMFAVLVFFFFVAMFLPFKNCYAIDRNNWMKDIMDDAKISWLTVPGTHDTTTFNLSDLTKAYATCQSMSIEEQLAAGVRAFDLRYRWENNGFYMYHGDTKILGQYWTYKCRDTDGSHLELSTVLQKFQNFLNAHPGEFIFVCTKHELGDDNTTELANVLNKFGVVSRSNTTTVGEVRGKMVNANGFMNRVDGTASSNTPYNRWDGSVDQKVADMQTVFDAAPSIYKYYSSSISQKCICTNLQFSGTNTPKDQANKVQGKFFGSNPFASYGQKAYGVILYDFPSTTILDWTISANDWAKAINCTFKFDSCGGSTVANQTVTECKLVTKPNDPLRNAYTFAGWYKNSNYTSSWNFAYDKAKDASTTLYAKWTPVNYKITYSGLDGATNPNKLKSQYTIETATYQLKDATKKGWKFLGWFDSSGTQVKEIKQGTYGDVSLTARFSLEIYDVKFKNIDGASNPNEVSSFDVNTGTIELQDATKDNYVFDGWYTQDGRESGNWGKQVTEIAGGATEDVDLYAKWTPVTYSIKYENATADENPNKTTEYTVETSTIQLKNAEREGYEFLGWFDVAGNKVTEIATGSFGDVVLTAKWSLCEHAITYSNLCGAENPNKVTKFSIESDTIILENPERVGYYFDGWYTSKGFVVTEITKGTNEDIALTARWTPINYTITYSNADDVENPNSNLTYTIETSTIKLKNCEKEGWVFGGWFEKLGVTTGDWGKQIKEIKQGSTGNITLYAKWTQTVSMMRLYNPFTGEHFYTSDAAEFDNLVALDWKDEGTGWVAPATSNTPVYRLYNPHSGDHHYTTSADERDSLTKVGWRDEGIGWYSDDSKGVALYRQYNPNATVGTHNYTTSKDENDKLVKVGWRAEGISWYGLKAN